MKLFNLIASTALIGAAVVTPSPVHANTRNQICTFNNGYGTKVQARMPCKVSWGASEIVVRWNDGVTDTYTLQYDNNYTDTRGGIWRLTTTRETGPAAALLHNLANYNQVIIE